MSDTQRWAVSYKQSVNERYGSDMNRKAAGFMDDQEEAGLIKVLGVAGGASLVVEAFDPNGADEEFHVRGTHADVRQIAHNLGHLIGKDVQIRVLDD